MKLKAAMIAGLMFVAGLCSAEVVFEENCESGEKFKQRWKAPVGWSLVESEINGRETTVLDIKGGGEALNAQGGLNVKKFDFEADFRIVKNCGGFVFRAQDVDNLYMMQFAPDDDSFYAHTKKNGRYSLVKQPLQTRIVLGQWRHIKFEIRGNKFKCFIGETKDRMQPAGAWEGKESFAGGCFGFRCVGSEHIQVDNIRISTDEPVTAELKIDRPALPRIIAAGRSFDVKVNVRNVGWKTAKNVRATLSLPKGLELAEGKQARSCGNLECGTRRRLSWKVKASESTAGRIKISALADDRYAAETSVDCMVNVMLLQGLSAKPATKAAAKVDSHKNVILENRNLRAVFLKNKAGYGAAVICVYDGGKWRQAAVIQPIGHIAYRTSAGKDVESDILPAACEILDKGGKTARVRFAAKHVGGNGCRWSFAFTFEVESGKKTIGAHYQVRTDKNRDLLYFQGPDLYAGEGSFGSRKHQALFPGLEYLEADERSSSDRDMIPRIANRYAPHPYKVTIPLMAVQGDNCLVGLMWDQLQKWDGKHCTIAARFASPNFKDKQDNHLMGLFLPSIPSYVPQNAQRAGKPYLLEANKGISIKAHIVADSSAELLDIIDHYFAAYGMPSESSVPETYDRILEKCRVGYMKTMWDAKVVGTRYWDGGPAKQFPNACAILWNDAVWTQDPAVKKSQKERVRLIVNKALEKKGVAGLVDPIDTRAFGTLPCHIRGYFLPFYIGHLEGGLENWKDRVYKECIETQQEDGSWAVAGHKGCKQGEEIVSGTVAELAGSILMYARITGDKPALESGLKALKYLDKFDVPRGAQVWEVPKYTPDILASGHALWAYIEAYKITGHKHYLEKAKYWAKTGIPFVYLWQAPDVKLMKYCTIPVFGTTHYRGSWFGNPVQWCGLVHGYWLMKLAEYDKSYPWFTIGKGIVDNGIQQMLDLWKTKPGVYTDSLGMIDRHVSGCKFEPESLMKPIFLMRGIPVEVNTRIIRGKRKNIHISSGAILESARTDAATGKISFDVKYPKGETSYTVIAGLKHISSVQVSGRKLSRADDLTSATQGWKVSKDGVLLIKVKHEKPVLKINIVG